MRVWVQKARYQLLVDRPQARRLIERLGDLGEPFTCDINGEPSETGTFLGHDDDRITTEDELLFKVLRKVPAAKLNSLKAAFKDREDDNLRGFIRCYLKSEIDTERPPPPTEGAS